MSNPVFEKDRAADRHALLTSMALTMGAVFVPQSASRNADEKPCLNWRITISREGMSTYTLTTDYMQGIGHLTGYVHHTRTTVDDARDIREAVENRRWRGQAVPAPTLEEVLWSLLMDGAADFDGMTFDEWCGEYGYDTDSRATEKTFDHCLEIGRALRRMVGMDTIEKLRETYQDY